jgi:3-oxoadipate CoA-transferase beta subunit
VARTKDEIAAAIARDIPTGSYVNLGIGQPTLVADHLEPGSGVVLYTENRMLGMGPAAHGHEIDPTSPTPVGSRSPSCRGRRTSTTRTPSR